MPSDTEWEAAIRVVFNWYYIEFMGDEDEWVKEHLEALCRGQDEE